MNTGLTSFSDPANIGFVRESFNTLNGSNAFVAYCNGRATSNVAGTGCSNEPPAACD